MPTRTVVTGLVTNVAGNVATSGTVQFQLQPNANSSAYRVSGTSIIAPNSVTATINASGQIKAENGTDPLELWGNDTISPANTFYRIKFFPDGVATQTWNLVLIFGTTYDLASPQFYETANFVPNESPPRFQVLESDIIPAYDGQYTLGTDQKNFASAYIQELFVASLTLPQISITGKVTLGNAIYIAPTGSVATDTLLIQSAIATGKSVGLLPGSWSLNDGIVCAQAGQLIFGFGRANTIITIPASFNLAATGVFIATSGETGPEFRDFGIVFAQPDTTIRGNLVTYPPAFYLRDTPRFRLNRIRISAAKTAVDMKGNSGGAVFDDVEISSFDLGVDIDGSLDTVLLLSVRIWPYGLTANQQTIFNDTSCHGFKSGRCDDLKMHACFVDCGGKQFELYQSASGTTFGEATGMTLDGYSAFVMSAGDFTMTVPRFTNGSVGKQAVLQTGGRLQMVDPTFSSSVATTNPFVSLSGAGTIDSGYMEINGGSFNGTGDMTMIEAKASSGTANLILTASQFIMTQNLSNSKAIVSILAGGRIVCSDNAVSDKGSGSGDFVSIAVDNNHALGANALEGWTISLPAGSVSIVAPYGPWITYTPTITSGSGSLTTVSATGRYKLEGQLLEFSFDITITTVGSAATSIIATLPAVPTASGVGSGFNSTDNLSLGAYIPSADPHVYLYKVDGTFPGASGKVIRVSGRYKIA